MFTFGVTTYLGPPARLRQELRKDVQRGNIETRENYRRACPEDRSSCELSYTYKIALTEVICTSYGSPKKIWMEKSLSTL
jgi:hypothetical protein